ncbi:MAG TPA: cytochrome P450 [Acidimicrobiia bacterium]|nr:cytochrome P450 [Acidimicrobiia bacterium]
MDEIGTVDPAAPEFWQDVHGTLAPLRERWPVVRSTAGDFEILRYEHVEPLLRDARLHQALHRMLANQGITSGPLFDWWRHIISALDPPEHTRIRSLIGRALSPRQVERVRPRIRAITDALLDRHAASGDDTTDVLDGICNALPLTVLCEMLGIAPDDQAVVEQWTVTIGLAFSAYLPPDLRADIERAIVEFDAFTSELIDRRRAAPADDLFSALVHAEEAGDRLTRVELQALVINLCFAGHDTTRSTLAIALYLLATHPEQLARLRADPGLVPGAVEEVVRYEPIISGIPRIPTVDLEVGGVHIPAGSYVTLSVPSANRDPRQFPDADRFDVTRRDNRHLGFGLGIHHCVGANVARAELQEALAVVVERCRALECAIDEPRWVPFAGARRFETLPMRLAVTRT